MPPQNYNDSKNDGTDSPQFSENDALLSLSGVSAADAIAPVYVLQGPGQALDTPGYDPMRGRSPGQGTTLGAGPSTFGDALLSFYKLPSDQMTTIQQDLLGGGFYPGSYYGTSPKAPTWGSPDEDTAAAYVKALRQAALSGRGLGEVLASAKKSFKGPKPRPKVIELTSSTDIAAAADAVARKTIGRKLNGAEISHFIDAYHSMEAASQRAKYTAEGQIDPTTGQLSGPGGSYEAPPTVSEASLAYQLRQEHPQEAADVDYQHGVEVFNELLKTGH